MCFETRIAKLSKLINNQNFCKKEKKEIDWSRDVTGMVDNMHSNLARSSHQNHSRPNGLENCGRPNSLEIVYF